MLTTIIKATENFCTHQMRLPFDVIDTTSDKRTLIAYIDIETTNNSKYRIYLACEQGFMQKVSQLFLEEDESDEETLIDMLLETANLIIGSAKVISEAKDENQFSIGTPHFEKIGTFDFKYDEIKVVKIENEDIIIAIRELDE